MKEEQAAEKLVHEVLVVLVLQGLLRHDQLVEVSAHFLCDDVDVSVVGLMRWSLDVDQFDYVFMFQEF